MIDGEFGYNIKQILGIGVWSTYSLVQHFVEPTNTIIICFE